MLARGVDLGLLDHGKENEMAHEWKVGDRFTPGFEVTGKEPQKLDISKPMELLDPDGPIAVTCKGVSSSGDIIVMFADGTLDALRPAMLRNIPSPKITGRREAALLSDGSVFWKEDVNVFSVIAHGRVVGRAWVEIAEGDGMEDEK